MSYILADIVNYCKCSYSYVELSFVPHICIMLGDTMRKNKLKKNASCRLQLFGISSLGLVVEDVENNCSIDGSTALDKKKLDIFKHRGSIAQFSKP